MKRHFFFATLFPPLFMNTLLVAAKPGDLLHYFLTGYFVAIVPALTGFHRRGVRGQAGRTQGGLLGDLRIGGDATAVPGI